LAPMSDSQSRPSWPARRLAHPQPGQQNAQSTHGSSSPSKRSGAGVLDSRGSGSGENCRAGRVSGRASQSTVDG
jgi:hypothetical protein